MKSYAHVVCIANTYTEHLLAIDRIERDGQYVSAPAAAKRRPGAFGILHAAGLVFTGTPDLLMREAEPRLRLTRAGREYVADALAGEV